MTFSITSLTNNSRKIFLVENLFLLLMFSLLAVSGFSAYSTRVDFQSTCSQPRDSWILLDLRSLLLVSVSFHPNMEP
jgi:hypothetical protein